MDKNTPVFTVVKSKNKFPDFDLPVVSYNVYSGLFREQAENIIELDNKLTNSVDDKVVYTLETWRNGILSSKVTIKPTGILPNNFETYLKTNP